MSRWAIARIASFWRGQRRLRAHGWDTPKCGDSRARPRRCRAAGRARRTRRAEHPLAPMPSVRILGLTRPALAALVSYLTELHGQQNDGIAVFNIG